MLLLLLLQANGDSLAPEEPSSLAAEGVSTASWDNARRYPIPLSRIQIPRTVDLLANYTSGEEIKWIMSEDGTDFKNHPVFCWSGLLSYVGQDRIFKYTLQDPTQYGMVDNCDWKLESDTSQYSTETAYIYVDNQAPVALDDVFYIGSGSSAAFNVLENDADYECTDHGYYTTRPICDMYVVNFTQPLYGTVKFPDSQPIFPWDRSQAAAAGSTAAAAAAKMSGAVSPAAAGGGGSIRDWKQNGLLQYALNYSIPRPLIDKFTYTVGDARYNPVTGYAQIRYRTATVTIVADGSSPSSTTSRFTLPDDKGSRSVQFTLPAIPTDRLGGSNRLLAIDEGPRRGSLVLLSSSPGSRTYKYTVAAKAAAVTDTIKYSVVTSDGQLDRGIVFFDIAGPPGRNTPPVAVDVYSTTYISPVIASFSGHLIDVLSSCYDANPEDAGKLSVSEFMQPKRGSVQMVKGGMLLYNASLEGGEFADSFAYWVKDARGAESVAGTVHITASSYYRPNSAAPIAVDDSYTVAAGGSITMDLLANDFDPDGDELQLTVHTLPRYGRLVRTRPGGGVLVYTPSPGIGSTTDSFRYYVSDGTATAEQAPATVTITITGGSPPNQPPVVSAITVNITNGDEVPGWKGKFSININLLQAATDPNGDTLHIARVQRGCCNTDDYEYTLEPLILQTDPVEVRSNSVYKFTLSFLKASVSEPCPPSIRFSYWVTDGKTTTQAWVHVVLQTYNYASCADPAGSYPSPPVLNPSSIPTYELKYGRSIFINLTQHGLHPQGRKLSSELVAYPSHGTVELVWEYVLRGYNDIDTDAFLTGVRYTPTGGYTGPDEISFRLLDIWRWWRSVDVGTVRFAVKPAAAAPCNMASCRAGGLCAGTKCGGPANGGCPQVPVVGANACICDATQGFMPGPVVNVAVAAFYQPEQHCAWNIVLPEMLVANASDAGRIVRVPFSVLGAAGRPICVNKPVIQMIRVESARMPSCPTGLAAKVLNVVPNAAVRAGSEACAAGASMFSWRLVPEKPARLPGCYRATVLTTDQQTHKVVLRLC
ncbi:hypothetical protein OEZ85_013074 [Tetradesmus obliquus]|uniref:RapA2 cadherin-like domain-containing protein n=1 Tax=Tetradesmus obliquus TaxID=3088 RepID=A0ABY8U4J7_TETOB|nr:hypothetical protein OEZ85_013074 [Tetradesmus obliquus]